MGLFRKHLCYSRFCNPHAAANFYRRKTTIYFYQDLWILSGLYFLYACAHKYRYGHRISARYRYSPSFFQLWRFIALGFYPPAVYLAKAGYRKAGGVALNIRIPLNYHLFLEYYNP